MKSPLGSLAVCVFFLALGVASLPALALDNWAADPSTSPPRQRLDLDRQNYPRHETWGIFLGTGWTREDLAQIDTWRQQNLWTNPFTGRSFDNAKVFAFGHGNPALEGLRIVTDHLEVHVLSSWKDLKGYQFGVVVCHSNGCANAIDAHKAGAIKVQHFVALGTDWTSKDFRPGELKGASLTFFTTKNDPIWKLPAPSWMRMGDSTPGLGFKVPFDRPSEIPRGIGNLITRGRSDPDRFPVILLNPPRGQEGSLAKPVRAHSLIDSYFPAIRKWMDSDGDAQRTLGGRIRQAEAAGRRDDQHKSPLGPPGGPGNPGARLPGVSNHGSGPGHGVLPSAPGGGPRGGISVDIPIGSGDFIKR